MAEQFNQNNNSGGGGSSSSSVSYSAATSITSAGTYSNQTYINDRRRKCRTRLFKFGHC